MIDFAKLNEILQQENELKECQFIDVDDNIEEALEYFEKMDNAFIRRSVNNRLHVILLNQIDGFLNNDAYSDPNYDGMSLFYNKGKKWSSPIWTNNSGKTRQFLRKLLIHVYICRKTKHTETLHKYFRTSHVNQAIDFMESYIKKLKFQVFFTFHVATSKIEDEYEIEIVSDKDKESNLTAYLNEYNFKSYINKEQIFTVLYKFKLSIPTEFLDLN